MVKIDKKWWKSTKNGATSILDGATSGDGLGAVLISPKILRKIQKNLRWYITGITRFLHVWLLLSQETSRKSYSMIYDWLSRRPVSNSVQSWPSKISDQCEQMQTPLNVSLILMGVGITEHWTQSMLSFVLLVLVPLTSGKGWTWTCDPDTSFCRFLIFSLFWVSQKCLNTFHLNAKNHVDTRYEMSKPSQERVAHQWHSFAR